MASMTDFLEAKLGDHVLRNIPYTSPTTVFLALFTTDPLDDASGTEVSGSGYTRVAATFGAPTVPPAATVYSNSAQIDFPIATSDYPAPVTHAAIADVVTPGAPNLLAHAPLISTKTIEDEDQFVVRVGKLTVEFA